MEIWKDIVGFEGLYQVSSEGRIKSLRRRVACKNGSTRELPEKILVPLYTGQGYLNFFASRKQKRTTILVHHAVAEHFIGKRPQGLVIDHIDGNKTNNRVSNLHYISCKENIRKRKDAKLNKDAVEEILRLLGHESQSAIAKRFGISQSMVSKINIGKAWADE